MVFITFPSRILAPKVLLKGLGYMTTWAHAPSDQLHSSIANNKGRSMPYVKTLFLAWQ